MAEVGKSIGKKTQAGREVYETPDGEMVSEKSTTFKYKGKWINIPTIHNGYAYDDDMLRMMLDAEVIEPTSTHKSKEDAINSAIERSKSLKFNEGGLADLNNQTEELFQGGTADQWSEYVDTLKVDIPEVSLKDAATFVAEMTPIVGDALAAKEVYDELQKDEPNYYLAGALGGAALVGLVPGLGDVAAKAIKKGAREVFDVAKRVEVDPNAMGSGLGNVRLKPKDLSDIDKAAEILDNPDSLKSWQQSNKIPENKRQANKQEAKAAAEDLYQGNITSKEARRIINEELPITSKYTAETMPEMPSVTDVAGSLGKKVQKTGVVGVKGFDIPAGTRVGSRLDIPAYNNYDKWVVSIHDGKNDVKGSVLGYGQAVRLKNIKFGSESQDALDIARGKGRLRGDKVGTDTPEKPMGKATIARVYGDYIPEDPYELQEQARALLSDPEWTQIGMNPYRQSNFYDKDTGFPVFEAEEVIQVGPLVLAKGVKKPTKTQLKELAVRTKDGKLRLFNQGGKVMNNQMEMAFMKQGGIKDDGMKRDPVSGNEIPPGSMAKEVRDDIPAMLSEGEYVVPADVLRFYGVNFFEDLRNKAKSGLQGMEQNGRIGGEPLSPQQVQQNMGQAPAPVQANQGGMMQGFNQAGLAGTPTPSSTFDPSKYSVVGGSTFNNQGQQAQQDSVTSFKTFINSADGSTQIVEFVDGKVKNPAMEKFTQPPYYEQGSSALKKAQSQAQASNNDDKTVTPDPVKGKGEDPKNWGLGVDWSDPKAYADSVLKNQMGRGATSVLQGLSALAGPIGVAAVGAGLGIQALSQVSNLRAAAEIARAQGMDEQAESIDGMIKSFMAEQPAIVDFLDDLRGTSNTSAMAVLDRMGMKYEEDPTTKKLRYSPEQLKHNLEIQERKKSFAKKTADETAAIQAGGGATGDDDGPFVFAGEGTQARDGSGVGDRYDFGEDTTDYDATDDDVFDQIDADFAAAGVSQNKGGLMAPKKKKKK
jgi:hypothetical protein